jgi:hypothetical protein
MRSLEEKESRVNLWATWEGDFFLSKMLPISQFHPIQDPKKVQNAKANLSAYTSFVFYIPKYVSFSSS